MEGEGLHQRYPLRGEDLVGVASVLNAEYDVMRGEIGRYQDHHKQIMNFTFVIMAAMFALVGGALGSDKVNPDKVSPLLFAFPPVYLLLACLYSDRTLRILQLA